MRKGFTIIEVMIVVALLSGLVLLAKPSVDARIHKVEQLRIEDGAIQVLKEITDVHGNLKDDYGPSGRIGDYTYGETLEVVYDPE